MKNQKGITLIALVITIIVLLILAGVSISMISGDDGIATKASQAAEKTKEKSDEEMEKLGSVDEYIEDEVNENKTEQEPIPENVIPEGGIYTTADGVVLEEGNAFPEIVTSGDVYVYGNYEYKYKYYYAIFGGWVNFAEIEGWGVKCKNNTVTDPGPILETINNEPITHMRCTFYNSDIAVVPTIPSTVTDLYYAFGSCDSLTDLSDLVIPEGLITLDYGFAYCSNLTKGPDFTNCTQLKTMAEAFNSCTSLQEKMFVPSNVVTVESAIFRNCTQFGY